MQPNWRRIILKVVLIVAIPVVVCFFFYKRLALFYSSNPAFNAKMRHLYAPGPSPYYLFLGSSRVIHHIDPRMIDSVCGKTSYNLGVSGFRILEMDMLLRVCIEQRKLPHVVVINIDGGTFDIRQPSWIFTDILNYADTDTVVRHTMARFQDVYACRWKYPFYRLQNYMAINDGYKVWALWKSDAALDRQTAEWGKLDPETHPDGFSPEDHPYSEIYRDPFNEKFQEEGVGVLCGMINLCREKSQ